MAALTPREVFDPAVVKMTRSVLLSSSRGLPLKQFTRDYKALVKSEFPYKRYGYKTAEAMLRAMVGVVRFADGKDGCCHLYGVGEKGCFMPSWVRKAQGEPTGNKIQRGGRSSDMSATHATQSDHSHQQSGSLHHLRMNSQGLVSLFVFWRFTSHDAPVTSNLNEQQIAEKREHLYQLMSQAGRPVQILVQRKGYAFVKFASLEEAEAAVNMFNGVEIDEVEYVVQSGYKEQSSIDDKMGKRGKMSTNKSKHPDWRKLHGSDIIQNSYGGLLPTPPPSMRLRHASSLLSHSTSSDHSTRSLSPSHNHHHTPMKQFSRTNSYSSADDDSHDIVLDDLISNDITLDDRPESYDYDRARLKEHLQNGICGVYHHDSSTCNLSVSKKLIDKEEEEEEDDEEWFESLLPPVTDFPFGSDSSGASSLLHQMLAACSGGLDWSQRVATAASDGASRDGVKVKVLETVSACHCWVQLVDSCELVCLAAVEKYLGTTSSSHPFPSRSSPAPGTVCGVIIDKGKENEAVRCWVPHSSTPGDDSQVFLIDRGVWLKTNSHNLFSVPLFVSSLPLQAIPCTLKGLKLSQTSEEDNARSGAELLRALTRNKVFHAVLTTPTPVTTIPEIFFPLSTNIISTIIASTFASQTQQSTQTEAVCVPHTTPISTHSRPSNHLSSFSSQLSISSEDSCFSSEGWGRSPRSAKSIVSTPNENGLTYVTVSEVVSPDQIWLQLSPDPDSDLDKISSSIAASPGPSPPKHVCVGQLYSLKLADKYMRVRVEGVKTNHLSQQVVSVFCVDTGTEHKVSLHQLSTLPPSLSISFLPSLALPCHLHGVVTTREDGQWWKLDIQWLWQRIRSRKVYAWFIGSPPLLDSSSSSSVSIAMRSTPVNLYFDPNGWDSVGDTLVSEGTYVGYLPGVGVQSPQ